MWWALAALPKHVGGGFVGGCSGLLGWWAREGSHTRGELPSAREPLNSGDHLSLVSSRTSSSGRMLTVWPQTRISCLPTRPLGWGWIPHCPSLSCLSPEPSLLPPLWPLLEGTPLSVPRAPSTSAPPPHPRAGPWAFVHRLPEASVVHRETRVWPEPPRRVLRTKRTKVSEGKGGSGAAPHDGDVWAGGRRGKEQTAAASCRIQTFRSVCNRAFHVGSPPASSVMCRLLAGCPRGSPAPLRAVTLAAGRHAGTPGKGR